MSLSNTKPKHLKMGKIIFSRRENLAKKEYRFLKKFACHVVMRTTFQISFISKDTRRRISIKFTKNFML